MNIKSILTSTWLRWLVSLILFGVLLAITDVSLIGATIKAASLPWLLAGLLAAMSLTAYGAVKWWVLMPRSRAAIPVFIRVNFISNFVGIFVPGIVGIEAARIAGITRSSKDFPAALASVLVDRMFGLTTLAITVMLGGILATAVVPPFVTIACLVSLVLLLGGGFLMMSYRFRAWSGSILPAKIEAALGKLYECLDLYRSRKPTLALSLVLSLIFQMGRVVMTYLLAISLSIDVSFSYLIVVVPVALFVQMIPISVYGIGIRESAMVALLAVAGVSAEAAISLSILMLGVQIAGSLPGGVLFALGNRLDAPTDKVADAADAADVLPSSPDAAGLDAANLKPGASES